MLPAKFKCAHKGCRRSVRSFDVEYETPKADGWGCLQDAGANTRQSFWLCPLHNMLIREEIEFGKIVDPATIPQSVRKPEGL